MLHLGPHAGLQSLDLLQQFVQLPIGIERLALARAHGYVPLDLGLGCAPLHLLALVHALVARVTPGMLLFVMQQACCLRHIVDVGSCADDGVHQS